MKIICRRSDLMNAVNIAMRAIPSKTTMPILESFLICADDRIIITSNDNDMSIETEVDGEIREKGKIAVEARLFSDIVRKLPENEVCLDADNNYKIRIVCEDVKISLSGNNPDEFPDLPETRALSHVSISEFTLKEMIRQTIFSIAVTDTNALMKGELFSISGNTLKMIALDSHRIAIRREKLANSYDASEVIIPGKTLNEISRILAGDVEKIVELDSGDGCKTR